MKALRSTTIRATACVVPLIVGLFGGGGIAAAQDPGPAKRDPFKLPLRFHGELFGRAEGRA
jgi:hypothetical protein